MPTFFNSAGVSLELGAQVGRGGEGTVYLVPVEPGLVAKLYHEPIEDEKAEKLKWMASNKNDQLLKVAAWIVDTLHERPDGRVVGFLMPNVRAKEIHELYSLKSRRVHFPEATWKFLVHAAANVARAFYSLHKNNHVMGDVNHGNCVVLRDGTVKLIDCDSYSISRGDFRYRCEVGVATHLAPELQGLDLSEVEREVKHDNFGLAVIIFQLLFLGRHPFAGMYLGPDDKSLEECIRERRFAYTSNAEQLLVKRPPGTLSLDQVPFRIATMFDRAFLTEDRPEAKDWIEALGDLSESLVTCATHPGHHYYKELDKCPWCEIETQTGLMLFPFVSSARSSTDEFDIFTVEGLVSQFSATRNLPAKPIKPLVLPPPDKAIEQIRSEGRARLFMTVALQLAVVTFISIVAGPGLGFLAGGFLMTVLLIIMNNTARKSKAKFEEALEAAEIEWNKVQSDWSSADILPQYSTDLELVHAKLEAHQKLRLEGKEREKSLGEAVFRYKLETYLAAHKIEAASTFGIERAKLDRLHALGVRSAADVIPTRLKALPPIDEKTVDSLVDWRENIERDFVYEPEKVPAADLNRIEDELFSRRSRLEDEIDRLLGNLRAGSALIKRRHENLETRARDAAARLAQCESNIKAVGGAGVSIIILILITLIVPIVVGSFRGPVVSEKVTTPPPTGGSGVGTGRGGRQTVVSDPPPYQAPDKLSDSDIANLTPDQRVQATVQFLKRARQNFEGGKLQAAATYLATAEKLSPSDSGVLTAIGELNYRQRQYKEAVTYFNRSLAVDSKNKPARILLGKTFLQLRYFDDARRVLTAVAIEDSRDDYEVQYNLGLAYQGLGQSAAAVAAFRAAVSARANDVDALYQLALSLNTIGPKEDVMKVYENINRLDPKRAAGLLKELGLKKPPTVENKTKDDIR